VLTNTNYFGSSGADYTIGLEDLGGTAVSGTPVLAAGANYVFRVRVSNHR